MEGRLTISGPSARGFVLQNIILVIFAFMMCLPATAEIRELTLEEAVLRALEQNQNLVVAREKVTQAVASYEQVNALKMPVVGVGGRLSGQPEQSIDTSSLLQALPASVNSSGFPSTFLISESLQREANASLDLLVSTFGRVENQILATFLQAKAESENFEVERNSLVFQTKEAFLRALSASEGVNAARLVLTTNREHLKETNILLEQGIVSKFDVVKAELEVSNAVAGLSTALAQQDLSQANLLFILNEDPPFSWHLQEPSEAKAEMSLPLEELQSLALLTRPEMKVTDVTREAGKKLVDAAYAESNPTLSFSLTYFTQAGSSLSPDSRLQAVLGLQIPLFDGGVRKAKVKEAESSLRQLEASTAVLSDQIGLEVEKAWVLLADANMTLETAQKNLETATLSHKMASSRYQHGISTSLELEDALRTLNDARINLVQADYGRALAFNDLERALGLEIPDRDLTAAFLSDQLERNDDDQSEN
jgi:outer membrane protein